MTAIRIKSVPSGEAPYDVRLAWVGTTLPITNGQLTSQDIPVVGVLTGPRTCLQLLRLFITFKYRKRKMSGFLIEGARAISILEEKDAAAAMWWRKNASQVLRPGQTLVFPADCCDVVPNECAQHK